MAQGPQGCGPGWGGGLWACWQVCRPPPTGLPSAALGVLEYRVLATNFRDHAVVFTQLELGDEAFSTVELYSECPSVGAAQGLLAELPPIPLGPLLTPTGPPAPSEEGRVLQAGRDAAP